MSDFDLKTPDNATDSGREAMEKAEQKFGFTPNLVRILANAPAAAHGYLDVGGRFSESSFSPEEQQVVLLATSFENGCDYCMAAHSTVAGMVGMNDGDLKALRDGGDLPTPRLNALRDFTRTIVETRGNPTEDDLRRFQEAGFEKSQVLEVVLGVTMKTLSNYTNHIAGTPLDEAFEPQRWERPAAARA